MPFHAHSLGPGVATSPRRYHNVNAKTKQKPEDDWSRCGPAQCERLLNLIPRPLTQHRPDCSEARRKLNITKTCGNIYICDALISCVRRVLLRVSMRTCRFCARRVFASASAVSMRRAEQQQCVAYSPARYLKCPPAKLKQDDGGPPQGTNLNSAMTQSVCPGTLAGFLPCQTSLDLSASPAPHLFLISRRQGKRSRKCQRAEQQVSLFTEKMGSVLLHQQQYCQ